MYSLTLTIDAVEPLIITDGSAESMAHQSLGHIPGNMLLGAFAAHWRRGNAACATPDDDPAFRALFLDGGVSWGHAYPLAADETCVPIPACFHKEKNGPGLCRIGSASCEPPSIVNLLHHEQKTGDVKRKKLDSGFMTESHCAMPNTRNVWNMHVSLDMRTRRAAEGQLFGYEAIGPRARFRSHIYCKEATTAALLRELAGSMGQCKVGHSRSAGYGTIRIEAGSVEEAAPQRIPQEDAAVVIYLLSDFMAPHSWQPPLQGLLASLRPLLGEVTKDSIRRNFCSHIAITGFNGLWQLPRTNRAALAKGGVLVLDVPAGKRAEALPFFLGGGVAEGYGRLCVNPEFLKPEFLRNAHILSREAGDGGTRTPPPVNPADPGVAVQLLRRQTLRRQAEELALQHVLSNGIHRFVASAERGVSQSQRGNIRRLVSETRSSDEWLPRFESMGKTARIKWENNVADSPHGQGRECLYDIMREFLKPDYPRTIGMDKELSLPGGPVTDAERTLFRRLFHKSFLLFMLQRWNRAHRKEEDNS